MSLYLRLVIGPVVVCDIDLFASVQKPDPDKEPPAQLAGGSGTLTYPEPLHEDDPAAFGFTRRRRRGDRGYSAVPNGLPKPPPPVGPGAAS